MTKRNMKKSEEWLREGELEKKLDELIEQEAVTPSELKANKVAEELGCSPSGSFYKRFNAWKASCEAEMDRPILEVSPQAKEELKRIIDEHSGRMLEGCENHLRMVGGALDHAAKLRTAEAERTVAEAEESERELIDNLIRVESERDEGLAHIDKLNGELQELRSKHDRLARRVEELSAQNSALHERIEKTAVAKGSATAEGVEVDATANKDAPEIAVSSDQANKVPLNGTVALSGESAATVADTIVEVSNKASADFAANLLADASKAKGEPITGVSTDPDQP